MSIEPEWYCPVIPNVLLNGAHDVGTGYLTGIPSYNPLTLFNNMKYYIQQEYYDCTRVVINDVCSKLDETFIEITDLSIGICSK
ncbi:unnamed protein product [Rotaria sp. Silwood2]|nr:unnamed protein product [Rotaria sp. Silwood2]CAF2817688.1 unnamed protein product [Rotaria sp. Silwood2]CAF3512171.1 unnamed protein product [Rotaria sp. Silwood2]CAF4409762.1 unnamed protein product [Rotaria sp. Silwood2]CAF4737769.1 unnamed protein product [Rotaria sp. Silwood2]